MGTVFDKAQLYYEEGQNVKSGSFNPNHHFQFWMDRILARALEEELGNKDDPDNTYGEKLLEHSGKSFGATRKTIADTQLITSEQC